MIYVVGFAMNPEKTHVLLVEKTHPDWQRGKLNGLGGKVEDGESSWDAMVREFREETRGALAGSVLYRREGWKHVLQLTGDDWQCAVFMGTPLSIEDMAKLDGAMTDEKERLQSVSLKFLGNFRTLPNVRWMLPFLACCHNEYSANLFPVVLHEREPGAMRESAKRA